MTCALCKGSGNHVCWQGGRIEWWTCDACCGAGVRWTGLAPAMIGPGAKPGPQVNPKEGGN